MATYKATLLNANEGLNRTIDCADDQSIFDAASDQDIDLPVSCRAGSCSSCAGKLILGTVNQEDQAFLDEDQIAAGFSIGIQHDALSLARSDPPAVAEPWTASRRDGSSCIRARKVFS